jgi:hypothetical protein
MTRERFNHLYDLVDEANKKVCCSASIEHGRFKDEIFITLFYADLYVSFYTDDCVMPSSCMHYDPDLIKAEAFLKMLIEAAKHHGPMRGDNND